MLFEKESPRDRRLLCKPMSKHNIQLGVNKLFKHSNESEEKKSKAYISMHSHSLCIYLSVLFQQRLCYTLQKHGVLVNWLDKVGIRQEFKIACKFLSISGTLDCQMLFVSVPTKLIMYSSSLVCLNVEYP